MRIGSLCSGYGGLDLGVQLAIGGTVAWHVEYDKDPSRILAHHWPDVPNHGDVKTTDWATVEPIDVLTAGYPCQPFSHAGNRKGTDDPRHLWPDVARAIGCLRPGLVVLENVWGHVSLGLDAVIGDLSGLGYDARWGVVRAADAGVPHGRARIFIVATDAQDDRRELSIAKGRSQKIARVDGRGGGRVDGPDAGGARERERSREVAVGGDAAAAPDAESNGRDEGWPEPARLVGGPDAAERGAVVRWGAYEPAIRRWERLTRPAPAPTETGAKGQPRLSPRFVEWLMGLPDGHVTAVPGLSRNAMLKALGNGVVPQQSALALRYLLTGEWGAVVAPETALPTPTAMDAAGSRNKTAYRSPDARKVQVGTTLTDWAWEHDGYVDPRTAS